jgi:Ran GTPase-activating protein (RanGAP) involved in mRNA processing and transport
MMRLSDNIQNIQRMNNKDAKKEEEEKKVEKPLITAEPVVSHGDDNNKNKDVLDIFDDPLHADVFTARCHDTGEIANAENARLFKEDILKRNAKASKFLKFQSLRLGVNSIIALSTSIQGRSIEKLNLADNCISDFGMHAIKTIINNMNIEYLNLASNMISGDGLECILEDLIKNTHLKYLDIGVVEGSIRKNSLGIQGAICISALLIRNKTLEALCLDDNDLGGDGGECLGIALAQNDKIKTLKVSENDLKSEGAIPIIKSAVNLEHLDISKNFLKSDVGKALSKLLKSTKTLKRLHLEYNELMVQGTKWIAKGLKDNKTLELLNIKGNIIGDDGCILLAEALVGNKKLNELDISLNEIGPAGFQAICEVLQTTKIEVFTCNKNFLGDDMLALFANLLAEETSPSTIKKFDFSSCRLNDTGLLYLINALQNNKVVSHMKLVDNFFSENIEAVLLQTLNKNTSLIDIQLQRNRLSHACLTKIKKIAARNQRIIEEDEPNKLKAEIYRLRYEHEKLEQARQQLKNQKDEIEKIKSYKKELVDQINRHKESEELKREKLHKYIEEQRAKIAEKEKQISEK